MEQLQMMFAQAAENRPREIEQTFTTGASTSTYSLSLRFERGKERPTWTLLEDKGSEAQMLWQQESSDFDLISDMLCMSAPNTAKPSSIGQGDEQAAQPSAQHPMYATTSDGFPVSSGGFPAYQSSGGFPAASSSGGLPAASQSSGFQFAQQEPAARETDKHFPRFSEQQVGPRDPRAFDGTLEKVPLSSLLESISADGLTGRLEILGDESVGEVYFLNGIAMFAHVAGILGDNAVRELVTWQKGTFAFFPDQQTEVRNVHRKLMDTIMEGIELQDKKKHLERLGLTPDAYLVKKHRNLGEPEVRLLLGKNEPTDLERQMEVYRNIGLRYSLTDLLRDKPMESADWAPLIFNFLTCDLIEIRPPDAVKVGALDFLGDAKPELDTLIESLSRPETGVLSYNALLMYIQHEFYRFESYGWPMSLILFEMFHKREYDTTKKAGSLDVGVDMLPPQAVKVAAERIEMVKRPLDIFGHYETLEYALLLPNTRTSSAAYIANRIMQTLTVSPLTKQIDKKNLRLNFGVANLPADGDTLFDLLTAARTAKDKAVGGNFPIVISKSLKS